MKNMSKTHDPQILAGIPRGVWTLLWADEQEEKGRSFSGQELTSIAPPTPPWAKKWGKKIADDIVRLNGGKSLAELYDFIVGYDYPNDKEQFGLSLGLQAVGHGVSWADDTPKLESDDIKLPRTEFYR